VEINAEMVNAGWALAFTKYADRYVSNENYARLSKRGLWSGSFVKPWEWRLGEAQAAQDSRECTIKGNISARGERIYHVPAQEYYSRTKIDEQRGERWFCSEPEALAAGWRRSLR